MKRICLVANSGWYIYNFRINLVEEIIKNNFEINIICPQDEYSLILKDKGYKVFHWHLEASSTNLFKEFSALVELYKLFNYIKPDLIQNFTIKPIIYTSIVNKFKVTKKIVNTFTGLGHIFISSSLKSKFLRFFVIILLKYLLNEDPTSTTFQNRFDQNLFHRIGILNKKKSICIRGSGIDTEFFKSSNKKIFNPNETILLFPSRMMKEKGLIELIDACKLLKNDNIKFQLFLVGSFRNSNISAIKKRDLKQLIEELPLKILGNIRNIKSLYDEVDIVVLPSWREGLSRSLLEAASMEKAILTSNVPGCSDIVKHGKTGLLVPKKNSEAIFLGLKLLIGSPNLMRQIGLNARKRVVKNFDSKIINKQIIDLYKSLI